VNDDSDRLADSAAGLYRGRIGARYGAR
jgi:hypothetical protein